MASLAGLFGNNKGFNAATVEPSKEYEPVPAGLYKAIITSSSVEAAKSGNGHNLLLTFKIVDGPHKNREIWDRLSVQNSNEMTQQIARGHFSAICHAVGQIECTTTEQLHSKPLIIKIAVKPHWNDKDRLVNEVKAYMALQKSAIPEPAMAGGGDFDDDAPF